MSELFTSANTLTYTLNGARTFSTSLDDCLDFFSVSGALRRANESRIISLFEKAFDEDPVTALRILFYTRDIRNGGIGEKKVFRVIVKHLPEMIASRGLSLNRVALYDSIVEFGSWKDLFEIFKIEEIGEYVSRKMKEHIATEKYDLLEKWAPSIGGSKNKQAEYLAGLCGLTPREYRKYLSKARSKTNVVEQRLCAKEWDKIEYDKIPSKAGLLYRNAFLKHDRDRYTAFLNDVAEGKKTVNASTLYPYEIVEQYWKKLIRSDKKEVDPALEALWGNLPNYVPETSGNAIVVADTSGSMYGLPMYIAVSLAVYFAERNTGKFHNEFMSFSSKPSFISIDDCRNLKEKIEKVWNTPWGFSTDIVKTFEEILDVGKRFNLPSSEMPETVYIVSDMEFDTAVDEEVPFTRTAYETIRESYRKAGYEIPSLVFWNVNSWQENVPVRKDENGTALVSGSSPAIFEAVMSKDLDPIKMMMSLIGKYAGWEEAVVKILCESSKATE